MRFYILLSIWSVPALLLKFKYNNFTKLDLYFSLVPHFNFKLVR